jgi:hypothetical protein
MVRIFCFAAVCFFFLSKGLLTILTSFGRLEQIPMICGTLRWWAVLLVVRVSAFSFFFSQGAASLAPPQVKIIPEIVTSLDLLCLFVAGRVTLIVTRT